MKLPDREQGCHRTGFDKKCRFLVTEGICKRWKTLPLQNIQTGVVSEVSDCIDNLDFVLKQLALKKHDEVGAEIGELRKEAKQRDDTHIAVQAHALGVVADATRRIELASENAVPALPPAENEQRLIAKS
jgi:hypothetical protein